MNRHARPAFRPLLESLEALSLMSVVPLVADGLHQSERVSEFAIKPVSSMTVPVTLRGGTIHGHYQLFITSETTTKHSQSRTVALTLTGNLDHVKHLSPATMVGMINLTIETVTKPRGMTISGHGSVILASFPDETLTLSLSEPVELRGQLSTMHYKITNGAGMYKGDKGSGTAHFTFRVLTSPQPWPLTVVFS